MEAVVPEVQQQVPVRQASPTLVKTLSAKERKKKEENKYIRQLGIVGFANAVGTILTRVL